MSRPTTVRKYGKQFKKTKADRLFAELPQSPVRLLPAVEAEHDLEDPDPLDKLTEQLNLLDLQNESGSRTGGSMEEGRESPPVVPSPLGEMEAPMKHLEIELDEPQEEVDQTAHEADETLRILTWEDVCPPGDRIEKIAEASYAEVYRVTNAKGTSIIKVIRLDSPIKPQTKAQQRSGLVDEEPHAESDLQGELQISEWLADIPGFVVYKERYVVRGRAAAGLLDTHQAFHRRAKRRDPDRLQFYPSPSRYLDDTRFLVVELGDAGTALEDFYRGDCDQVWDVFLLVAIALARAEEMVCFEHRDLHEGNLCIRPGSKEGVQREDSYFGASGLDITILDYGLSRAEDGGDGATPVFFDLEKDLSVFTSTHAPQCQVYRQMRSLLLTGTTKSLPPSSHQTPYAAGPTGPITWAPYTPRTNVLWLAYLYQYLVANFQGDKKDVAAFKRTTRGLWSGLDPGPKNSRATSFQTSAEVVRFAVEEGWIQEDQLMGVEGSLLHVDREDSIIVSLDEVFVDYDQPSLRRSPRRRQS